MSPSRSAAMPEIQRADVPTRRRALFAAGAVAVAGWAALFVLQDWLAELHLADPVEMRHALEDAMLWGSWDATRRRVPR